jgi:hypothetical protein
MYFLQKMERKSSPDVALASDVFDQFCAASTLKSILTLHRHLCELLRLRPAPFPDFYPPLRNKLRSWRAQALWTKFDKRASHKCYNRGLASAGKLRRSTKKRFIHVCMEKQSCSQVRRC